MNPIALYLKGLFSLPSAMRFLRKNPRLLTYVAVPVSINTLLYTIFIWVGFSRFFDWLDTFIDKGESLVYALAYYATALFFGSLFLLVLVYTFTLVGNVILAPFNDLLSEKVEGLVRGKKDLESFSLSLVVRNAVRSVKAELGRLSLYIIGFLLLLLVNLIPVIGPLIYGGGLILFSCFFLGWEFFDYSMERKQYPFRKKRELAFSNLFLFLGFGSGAALFMLIPLFGLILVPVCVVGATLLFCERTGDQPPEWMSNQPDDGM